VTFKINFFQAKITHFYCKSFINTNHIKEWFSFKKENNFVSPRDINYIILYITKYLEI